MLNEKMLYNKLYDKIMHKAYLAIAQNQSKHKRIIFYTYDRYWVVKK